MLRSQPMAALFALFLIAGSPAVARTVSSPEEVTIPRGELPNLVRTAADDFQPFTAEQLDTLRNELTSRITRLDRYLTPAGANGQAWKDYLLWDDLTEQLAPEAPLDVAKLVTILKRYRKNHAGLELPVFAEVADALLRYIYVSDIARHPNSRQRYALWIEQLATLLEKHVSEPENHAIVFNMGRQLGRLDQIGQAPNVVRAVHGEFNRPNLHVSVATALIDAGTTRTVERTQPVTDIILGTHISGTATSSGSLHVTTVPSPSRAHVQLALAGTIQSNTVGVNGPVCIYSTGQTPYEVSKDIFFTARGPEVFLATATARTHSDIHCIESKQGRIGSRLIERVAWRRAGKQQNLAEAIAAQHAEYQLATQFDRESVPLIDKLRTNYDQKFRLPLIRRAEMPRQLDFASTDRALQITALQANRFQLGAPTSAPPIESGRDLTVRVHESFLNNLANTFLAEFILTDTWLKEKVVELKGALPPELQDEDEEPWSVAFARTQPVSVTFADGSFAITIRGRQFTSGDRTSDPFHISVRYAIEHRSDGFVFVRQGKIEALPADFNPENPRSLDTEEAAFQGVLQQRLEKLFKPEIPTEGLELPGELKKLGRLFPVEITCKGGWLAIGWNRPQ